MSAVDLPVRPAAMQARPAESLPVQHAGLWRPLQPDNRGSRVCPDHGALLDKGRAPRSGRVFVGLLEAFRATGGTAPEEIVGRLLEEHGMGGEFGLSRLLAAGSCFGFDWRGVRWIPMFQFDADTLALKDGPQHVLAAMPYRWSGWTRACWLTAPNAWLAGRRPVDMLETDALAVRGCVQRLGQERSAPPELPAPPALPPSAA